MEPVTERATLQEVVDKAIWRLSTAAITPRMAQRGGATIPTHVGGMARREIRPSEKGYTEGLAYLKKITDRYQSNASSLLSSMKLKGQPDAVVIPKQTATAFFEATGREILRPDEKGQIYLSPYWSRSFERPTRADREQICEWLQILTFVVPMFLMAYLLFFRLATPQIDMSNGIILWIAKATLSIFIGVAGTYGTTKALIAFISSTLFARLMRKVGMRNMARAVATQPRETLFRGMREYWRWEKEEGRDSNEAIKIIYSEHSDRLERVIQNVPNMMIAATFQSFGLEPDSDYLDLTTAGWGNRQELTHPVPDAPAIIFFRFETIQEKTYVIIYGTLGELSEGELNQLDNAMNQDDLLVCL